MSLTVNLMLRLDGRADRQYFIPGGMEKEISEESFRYFDLVNLTSNTSAGGEVYINVGWLSSSARAAVTGAK
jgi:hypothetical protein